MEKTVYKSGISTGIIIILTIVIVAPLIMTIIFKAWTGIIILACCAAFIGHLFAMTDYTVSGSMLKVRSGIIINMVIDIATITKIEPTDSILSSPALSFDRLEVFYNKYDSVIISPKDKAGFIAKLKEINPGIVAK
jgi:hypothetical protein